MSEAVLEFKREGREGIIPVGTYLLDAAKRFGVLFEEKCSPAENQHFCKVAVLEGENALTPPTSLESEFFAVNPGDASERLACQTRISKPEDIVIMTEKKKDESAEETSKVSAEEYAKEFKELPLEKKIAELVQLEAITLSDTFTFIFNSPYLIFGKVMDIMAEFGMKKEEAGKKATRPPEHSEEAAESVKDTHEPVSSDPGTDDSTVVPAE